jgi:ribosomal protein L11 methyltransferase
MGIWNPLQRFSYFTPFADPLQGRFRFMKKLTTWIGNDRYSPMSLKQWMGITLLVPNEFKEGISNFLMEQGATGIEEFDEDVTRDRLRAYFLEDGREKKVLQAFFRYLKSLKVMHPEMPSIQFDTFFIPDQDWSENWKRFFKPVQVTSRLVVKPPWSKIRLKKNQIPINIRPGMAFGTGTHATTKLCIKALESGLRRKGLSVLDVGTGSGILSIAAAQLGSGEVWGLDIDGAAIENARENVKLNSVSDIVKIRKGRIGDIHKKFDVVVANIDLKNLKRMKWPLLRHLKSQGLLILSGILEREGERLRRSYLETDHFQWARITHEEEWVCITMKKK